MKQTKKWKSIQALRGVAALGVLASHSLRIESKYSGGDTFLPEIFLFGMTGVDLFFVISGFIMVAVTRGRFSGKGEVSRFLWHRVTRIYPTYWFYLLLTLAVFIVRPMWVNASQGHEASLISSFLLIPSNQAPLVMVAWSLVHEVWFYIVFAVLLKAGEKSLPQYLFFWAVVVLASNIFINTAELTPVLRIAVHPYTLEFIIGALVSIITHKEGAPHQAWLVIAVIFLCGIPFVGELGVLNLDVLKTDGLYRVGIIGPMYGALILSITTIEKRNSQLIPKSMVWIGDMSYTIYLSHVLILSALGRIWAMTHSNPGTSLDNVIALSIMWFAAIGYGWIGYRLVELPLANLAKRLQDRLAI
jgi:exopolysaccharide production protein ExoZ